MNTTAIGLRAERQVAAFLERKGFQIVDQNWKTRYCEIDIIALRESTIYFVEVKYRATAKYGSGMEYITHTKLKQMQFAARLWSSWRNYQGPCRIFVAEVAGPEFQILRVEEVT